MGFDCFGSFNEVRSKEFLLANLLIKFCGHYGDYHSLISIPRDGGNSAKANGKKRLNRCKILRFIAEHLQDFTKPDRSYYCFLYYEFASG